MSYTVHVIISGKVQGVYFREQTKEQAALLGVTGWVRNTEDGRVEAIFEGERDKVEKLVDWCHTGPSLANVKEVISIPLETAVNSTVFEIKDDSIL
jgi:acylphosphatase